MLLVAAGLFAQSPNKAENGHETRCNEPPLPTSIRKRPATRTQRLSPLPDHQTDSTTFPAFSKWALLPTRRRGAEQLGIWRKGSGSRAGHQYKGASWVKGNSRVLRLRGHARRHGPRLVAGHAECGSCRRRQPGVRQEKFFGNRNPIGHRLAFPVRPKHPQDGAHEIVGVVENTTYTSVYWKNHAMYFLPSRSALESPTPTPTTLSTKTNPCMPARRYPDRPSHRRLRKDRRRHTGEHQPQPHHRKVPDISSRLMTGSSRSG